MPESFILSSSSSTPARRSSEIRIVDGQPVARFVKDVIRDGKFVKRDKATGRTIFELEVTPERRKTWVDSWRAMKEAGKPVKLRDDTGAFTLDAPHAPVTTNHAGAFKKSRVERLRTMAENVVCDTVDIFNEGDTTFAVVEVKGERALDLVTRNKDTSPEIDVVEIDGEKTEAITAISIVANPLVPGQKGFELIAASADTPERFILSSDDGESPMKVAQVLAATIALAGLAGISQAVTEDNVDGVLEQCRGKFESQTKALSADVPNPTVVSMACRMASKEFDRLKGIMTDAGIAKLREQFVGNIDKKEFSTLALSADSPEAYVSTIEKLVDAIVKDREPLKKGAKSGVQGGTAVVEDTKNLSGDDELEAGEEKPDPSRAAVDKILDAHVKSIYGHVAK
jgi:hypothetical protein